VDRPFQKDGTALRSIRDIAGRTGKSNAGLQAEASDTDKIIAAVRRGYPTLGLTLCDTIQLKPAPRL
jgi:hypothetical protein